VGIRIKNNTITTNLRGLSIDIDALFYGLKPQEQRIIQGIGLNGYLLKRYLFISEKFLGTNYIWRN